MPIPWQGTNFIRKTTIAFLDVGHDILQLLPVAAFLFISSIPAESLAFVDQIELSHQPLVFVRDPSLADTAIVGIEAFPRHTRAGPLLRSPASRIPSAPRQLASGMAVRVMATAYSSTVDQTDGNPWATASGTTVHRGTLAANFLPFGSQVRIGNQLYTVEDRLNARYNGKYIVDLWLPSRAEAIQYGVRVVEMEIISLPGE
ncbi:MAG: 3D domain-containing protein [Candidatus Andersenbacteria bacterium]